MSGLAIKTYNNPVINVPQTVDDVVGALCGCNSGCFYNEWVFASNTNDFWKKDYTDFLYSKVVVSDTITIKLYKDCQEIVTISDDTYGTYYNGFTDAPLYIGWLADWTLIFDAFGGGQYQVKTEFNILGNAYTVESRKFRLAAYDEDLADSTVKIETYQTGNILRSPFDYSLLLSDLPNGWYSSIRVGGFFRFIKPDYVEDRYLDTSYNTLDIQPSIMLKYLLDTKFVPDSLNYIFYTDNILASSIQITSYNLNDDLQLRRVEVVPDSIDDYISLPQGGKARNAITFKEKKQDIIQRYY